MARPPSRGQDMFGAFKAGVTLPVEASAQTALTGKGPPDPAARDAVARFGRPEIAP